MSNLGSPQEHLTIHERLPYIMSPYTEKKVRKTVRSGEAVRKESDWGKKDSSYKGFTVDFRFSLQHSLTKFWNKGSL